MSKHFKCKHYRIICVIVENGLHIFMKDIITDQEIKAFIEERKVLPDNWLNNFKTRENRGFKEHYQDITGEDGNTFRLIVKVGDFNKSVFSVVLVLKRPEKNNDNYFFLLRYNGCNHQHTNDIEGESMTGFHIHTATERYQKIKKVEGYAQPTTRYSNVNQALKCLLEDANFDESTMLQQSLFEEV